MGKNKKGSASGKGMMFKVIGNKVKKGKNKSKEVTTNLKKINVKTKAQTESVDKQFTTLRGDVAVKPKDNKKSKTIQPKANLAAPADVDMATDIFAKL